MSKANMGWLFYKEQYRKGKNDIHIQKTLSDLIDIKTIEYKLPKIGQYGFELTTTYPGLIIGSGYTHGISSDSDTKMGFYFDHTIGVPIIPASSIKGVLRSLFGLAQKNQTDKYKEKKEKLIRYFVGNKELNVELLAKEIFEGIRDGELLPSYQRDKFFDATIVRCGRDGVVGEDYITPHKEPLKNPVPLKIIKVMGGVTFRFDFQLHDFCDEDGKIILSAEQKEELFLELLLFHGVGAKTNVGYGQFEEWSDKQMEEFKKRQKKNQINNKIDNLDSPFEKLKLELEKVTKAKSIWGKIKNVNTLLNDNEKMEIQKIVDSKVAKDAGSYKKIMKLLQI